MLVSSSGGGAPQVKQQSWPVPHAGPLPQLVMNKGAGVRSAGAWACPPARVARNCAVAASVTGAGTDAGGGAMACANGRRVRRARRTRRGFFIGSSPQLTDRQEAGRLQRKECLMAACRVPRGLSGMELAAGGTPAVPGKRGVPTVFANRCEGARGTVDEADR